MKNNLKKIDYYPLRLIEPSLINIFSNHQRFEFESWVGYPKGPKESGLQYQVAFVECDICGALIGMNKILIVKYGTAVYMRQVFCLNCFRAYFPPWKQWLINHWKWYEKRFIARYFHLSPNWDNIQLRSDVFFMKKWFPNVPVRSPYDQTDIAKNPKEFREKLKIKHNILFADEIKERDDEEL